MLMLNVSLWSALGARPAPSGPSVDVTVNAITGDDAGAPGTPAATLAEGMARLSSGETLGLATGSLWREQLGIAHADVAVTATGAGAAPIIDGAGVVAGPWTPHATHADVWSTAWTRETAAPSGTEPLQIYIDGVQPRRAASLADLAGNGGWYVDDRFAGTTTIYVRSATDPAGTGALYEAGARDHNILWHDGDGGSGVTGVALTGPLELTRALGHYGNLAAGEARYDRLLVRDGGLHHAVVDGDATDVICAELRRDFSVSGEGASNAYPFTIYRADPAGLSRTARRVMVINDRPGQGAQGFYAHGSPGEWGAVTLEQCAAVDCSTGIDASAETLTLEGCYVERAARGVSIVRPTTRVSHLMINDPVWTGSGDYMLMGTGGTETRDIHTVIEHCVFYIADASLADFVLRWGRNGSITVRNCAFVFNAGPSVTAAMQISRYGNPGTVSATIENNLFFFPECGDYPENINGFIRYSAVNATNANYSITADNNLYVGNPNASWRLGSTTYQTFAAFIAATGTDAGSVFLDRDDYASAAAEIFAGDPASGDFRLNDLSGFGTFGDGSALSTAGPQEHWDWNARAVAAGAPQAWPALPRGLADQRAYIADPDGWTF